MLIHAIVVITFSKTSMRWIIKKTMAVINKMDISIEIDQIIPAASITILLEMFTLTLIVLVTITMLVGRLLVASMSTEITTLVGILAVSLMIIENYIGMSQDTTSRLVLSRWKLTLLKSKKIFNFLLSKPLTVDRWGI